jgi:hypothetical protein
VAIVIVELDACATLPGSPIDIVANANTGATSHVTLLRRRANRVSPDKTNDIPLMIPPIWFVVLLQSADL